MWENPTLFGECSEVSARLFRHLDNFCSVQLFSMPCFRVFTSSLTPSLVLVTWGSVGCEQNDFQFLFLWSALKLVLPYNRPFLPYRYLEEHPEINAKKEQFCFTSPKGRTDPLAAGVSTKKLLKTETQLSPRKRIKGNPEMKISGHGQPPRPQSLIGKGSLPKSASKLNVVHQDNSKLKQHHGLKSAPHPMAIKREKLEADRGANWILSLVETLG